MSKFSVHLVISDCDNLPTRFEVWMENEANTADEATANVKAWHREKFGSMTISERGTQAGALL